MRRLPNPWFLLPVLGAAALGALLGREVARVTCSFGADAVETGRQGCPGFEVVAAIGGAIVAAVGVAVVVTLAIRSLAEWRETRAAEAESETSEPG